MDKRKATLILAEDDPEDHKLAKRALDKLLIKEFLWVKHGRELLDALENPQVKRSCLILLDLNMPVMDGREALEKIRGRDDLKHIPIIIMTTSKSEEDVLRSYRSGANAYIRKPIDQNEFLKILADFKRFWLEIVELPVV